MNTFSEVIDFNKNLLPRDGTVNYYGKIFNQKEADELMETLLRESHWKFDEAVIFGKHIQTKRKVAWYGDEDFQYTYSGSTKIALPWSQTLFYLKNECEKRVGTQFNSCLLNLYQDGSQGMAYHSDGEKNLKKNGAITALSFGARRKFSFKHKQTKERVDIWLDHGSLLVMKDETQAFWMHRLPPTKKVLEPRISLTFRTIVK